MTAIITDPLGRKIILYDNAWFYHIVPRHPIMKNLRKQTELTLEKPNFICQSKIDEHIHLYYKQFKHKKWGKFYLMVVVDIINLLVKTAFLVYNFNKAKTIIWP